MLKSSQILESIAQVGVKFITGVPDSTFKDLLSIINSSKSPIKHAIAVNEGDAVALAGGYHLATGKLPLVYMQNSGLGNAVNPLTSLMDPKVYSLPLMLLIGWRGEPGKPDEPQHARMGEITLKMLETLEIPYEIASGEYEEASLQITRLANQAISDLRPVALVLPKGLFVKEEVVKQKTEGMLREEALEVLLEKIRRKPIVSTTGKTSREIFEIRERHGENHNTDFLTVGSMGCSLSIGVGLALARDKEVFVIDGDGAVLMRMGALTDVGCYQPKLIHIVIDNGVYESTGSQPTLSRFVSWPKLFDALGYADFTEVSDKRQLQEIVFEKMNLPAAVVVRVVPGSRSDLGRPTTTPIENKRKFEEFLREK